MYSGSTATSPVPWITSQSFSGNVVVVTRMVVVELVDATEGAGWIPQPKPG